MNTAALKYSETVTVCFGTTVLLESILLQVSTVNNTVTVK